MRHGCVAVLVWFLAACATTIPESGGFVSDGYLETVRIRGGDGQVVTTEVGRGGSVFRAPIRSGAAAVWGVMPDAFRALGLEVNVGEPRQRMMGVENVRLRSIDGGRPSRYLECGQGVTGANADRYDIYLSLISQVRGAGDGSEVHVLLEAVARNAAHGGSIIRCGSTGRLEERLVEEVEKAVGAADRGV